MTAATGASGGSPGAAAPAKRPRTIRTAAATNAAPTKAGAAKAAASKAASAKKPAAKAQVGTSAPAAKPTRVKGSAAEPAPVASPAEPAVVPPIPALELYFVRHADAGDPAEWSGDDADRPLSKKGRRQARRLAAALDDLKVRPDVLLTSPKLRSADTAKALSRRLRVPVTTDQRLAGELDGQGLESLLADVEGASGRVMLVGHDPDFSQLVSWLVGGPVAMRKGALARVDLPGRTAAAGLGSLRWLLPPDAFPG